MEIMIKSHMIPLVCRRHRLMHLNMQRPQLGYILPLLIQIMETIVRLYTTKITKQYVYNDPVYNKKN
jgi:hypothetical protein